VKIWYYDRGQIHQAAGIPDLPDEDEVPFVFSQVPVVEPSIVGNELWRTRILHRFIDDGHTVVWGSRRRVMPSAERDWDLQRLLDERPEFAPWVRETDPMLDCEIWDVHDGVEESYLKEVPTDADQRDEKIIPGYAKKWYKESRFGLPPQDVDIAIIHVMRANPIAGIEQSYMIGKFLECGIPVIVYDNNRMMPGTVNSLRYWDMDLLNHPLFTLVAPYEESYGYGEPHLLDFPYVKQLELEPAPESERNGSITYVGNEYDRWRAMLRMLLPLHRDYPIRIWGKYDSKKGMELQKTYPNVHWMGRTRGSCRARKEIAHAGLTCNMLRGTYASIGLVTYRTFDSPCYGTLQYADAKIKRIEKFVPREYLCEGMPRAREIADRVASFSEDQYMEELEKQRAMVRGYDFDAYFMPTYYSLIEMAMAKAERPNAVV
jgi:hypothetical protein